MISALVDNCVLNLSETMRTVRKSIQLDVGTTRQTYEVLALEHVGPREEEKWKLAELECLPTVARLAREGLVQLVTYGELEYEAWSHSQTTVVGDIFADVPLRHVAAAVERSCFFQVDASKVPNSKHVVEFCRWLLGLNVDRLDSLVASSRFPPFTIQNLRKVDRFRSLCAGLAERQYPDAFHLWTAEVNGLQYFLTTDRKFIRAMTESSNQSLPCEPISPSTLLAVLGISERDPVPHPQNSIIDIFGNPL